MKKLFLVLIIITLSSCGSVTKINGIEVKRSHQRQATKKDAGIIIAAGMIGYAATLHFKTKEK